MSAVSSTVCWAESGDDEEAVLEKLVREALRALAWARSFLNRRMAFNYGCVKRTKPKISAQDYSQRISDGSFAA